MKSLRIRGIHHLNVNVLVNTAYLFWLHLIDAIQIGSAVRLCMNWYGHEMYFELLSRLGQLTKLHARDLRFLSGPI